MNKYRSFLFIFATVFFIACGNTDDAPQKSKSSKPLPPPKKELKKAEPTTSQNETKSTTTSAGATPEELAKAKEIIANASEDAVAAVNAKKKYKMYCTTCHGTKGDLNINGAKDLTISKTSLVESVAQVYHGKGLMTPFRGILKDEEIVAVSKYIVKLRR